MNATKTNRSALRRWRGALSLVCAAALFGIVAVAPAQASIGLESFTGGVYEEDGSSSHEAAGHPFVGSTTFEVASEDLGGFFGNQVKESVKDAIVSLPPGFVGNPLATPTCSLSEFSNFTSGRSGCAPSTQVGLVYLNIGGGFGEGSPLFNLVPPAGVPAAFGFTVTTVPVTITPSVRTGGDYGIDLAALNTNQYLGLVGVKVELWGDPSDSGHDEERIPCLYSATGLDPNGQPCHSEPSLPLIAAPSDCSAGPLPTTMHMNSWQDQASVETLSFDEDENGEPTAVEGCDEVPFKPTITALPTTNQADSPSGLSVNIHLPQQGYEDVNALNSAYLKKATVTLPEGMTVNPSSANGLGACSEAQIELNGPKPAACPNDSKLGNVEIHTPVLADPLKGGVYLAAQKENKFGSLLATYIAVDDPQTGVVVKLAGKIESNAQTGRITATFDENPQLPFTDLEVDFYGGPAAPLRTPAACGKYGITGTFSSWSAADPNNPTADELKGNTTSFDIASGPGGTPCPAGQFDPKLTAGTATPFAATYSPFSMRVTREDGTQQLNGLNLTLPKGLTGKLAGVPYCPETALAAISGAEGTGRAQISSPSCPAASQVGTVTVGAGAGTSPFYVNAGKAYLAGPYKGAPISLAIVTPAVAGPFDLGNVLVRTALRVNPETTQITAVSDPIPTILHGIPLDLRDIRVNVDRDGFTLNPTNCEEMGFSGSATAPSGATAPLADRFQAVSCAALAFKPGLTLQVKGGHKRGAYQRLKAVVKAKPGEANIGRVSVALPHSQFLAQEHIVTVCTRVQFAADACPKGSIYGNAKAWTPLLDQPLHGPVYLRSNGGERQLPDIVAALHGQVDVDLVGFIDSKKGGIRNTFQSVPDAPVTKFELNMKGGKKSLLVNSRDICRAGTGRATVKMGGQNGKFRELRPLLQSSCKGKGGKSKGKKAKGGKGKRG